MGFLSKLPRAAEPPAVRPSAFDAPSAPTLPGQAAGDVYTAAGAGTGAQRWPSAAHDAALAPAAIAAHLRKIVAANELTLFYPTAADLDRVADDVVRRVDFGRLRAEWGLTPELMRDLTALALYNVVVLADDSSSMGWGPGGENLGVQGPRWQALRQTFDRITRTAALFDDDGIDICFLNDSRTGSDLRPEHLDDFLASITPRGATPLAASLEAKVLDPLRCGLQAGLVHKPTLVLLPTDGAPYPERPERTGEAILRMRQDCLAGGWPAATVAYGFAQIGDDRAATDFLDGYDNHPIFGRQVDVTSDFAIEQRQVARQGRTLTWGSYMVKMMVGAIDPDYDDQDEGDGPSWLAPGALAVPRGGPQGGLWGRLFG